MSGPLNPSPATCADFTQPATQPPDAQLKTIGEDETTSRNNLQTVDTPGTDKNAQYFPLGFRYADGRES